MPYAKKIIRPRSLLQSQLLKAIEEVDSCRNPRDVAIFYLFLDTGIRLKELRALRLDDISPVKSENLSANLFNTRTPAGLELKIRRKDKTERVILLLPRSEAAIRKYLEFRETAHYESPYLFVSRKADSINRHTVYDMLRSKLKQGGGKNGPLILRNTFIKSLLEKKVDIPTVCYLSDIKSTKSVARFCDNEMISIGNVYRSSHPRA